jgi:hypothetical protein
MKILKEPEKDWALKFACAGCGAELEAEATDIRVVRYDGDCREPSYTAFSVSCPCCKQDKALKEAALPKLVVIEALKRSKIRE